MTGLIGDFPLDDLRAGKVANRADPKKPGQTSEGPELVDGRVGKAASAQRRKQRHASPGQLRPLPAVLARRCGSRRPITRIGR